MLVSTIAAAIRSSKHQLRGPTSKIAVVARVGRDHSSATKDRTVVQLGGYIIRTFRCARSGSFLARRRGHFERELRIE